MNRVRIYSWIILLVLLFTVQSIIVHAAPSPPAIPSLPPEYICTPTNGSIELCDGVDNNCDGLIDNSDSCNVQPVVDESGDDGSGGGGGGGGGGGSGGGSDDIVYFPTPADNGGSNNPVNNDTLPSNSVNNVDVSQSGVNDITDTTNPSDSEIIEESNPNPLFAKLNSLGLSMPTLIAIGVLFVLGIFLLFFFIVHKKNGSDTVVDGSGLKVPSDFKKPVKPVVSTPGVTYSARNVSGGNIPIINMQGDSGRDSKAINYITQMRQQKYPDSAIREQLKKAGYVDAKIDFLLSNK